MRDFIKIKTPDEVYEAYTFVVIHELIHNVAKNGYYNDVQVFDAVIAILKEDGLDAPEYTDVREDASNRINQWYLSKYCPKTSTNNDGMMGHELLHALGE